MLNKATAILTASEGNHVMEYDHKINPLVMGVRKKQEED
jgi:hypothetical protein